MPPFPYTTESLDPDDPRLVPRVPGVGDLERLFAAPSSIGRGTLSVEGGVSLVAGPGMGKTTMLRQVAQVLHDRRGIATAYVPLPAVASYGDPSGFYPYLGAVLTSVRSALLDRAADSGLPSDAHDVLNRRPSWLARPETASPPAFEEWMQALGAAARHGSGLCLLFDDVDDLEPMPWKQAFVSALRFTFQSCPGITPVYAVWMLFRDESLSGSNYFRNVTRPVFLAPLSSAGTAGGARAALVSHGIPGATPDDVARVSSLVGGHPLLLHRVLGDVAASGWTATSGRAIDALLRPEVVDEQRRLVGALLASSPGLAQALRQLGLRSPREALPYRSLAKGLTASGLVDESPGGATVLPARVAEMLARP